MKIVASALVAAALLTATACGSSDEPAAQGANASPSSAASLPRDVQADKWRENARKNIGPYTAALARINTGLDNEERAEDRGRNTCDAIRSYQAGDLDRAPAESARLRFEGGDSGPLTQADSRRIVQATIKYVCPGLGAAKPDQSKVLP